MDLSYILNSPDVERIASALEMLADNSDKSIFTDAMKTALLNIFQHVAYTDDQGQAYYDALYAALYGGSGGYPRITADFAPGSHVVYENDALDTLKPYLTVTYYESESDDGTVIGVDSYQLSGDLSDGSSRVVVEYGTYTATFTVATQQLTPIGLNKYGGMTFTVGQETNAYALRNPIDLRGVIVTTSNNARLKKGSLNETTPTTVTTYSPIRIPKDTKNVVYSFGTGGWGALAILSRLDSSNYVRLTSLYNNYFTDNERITVDVSAYNSGEYYCVPYANNAEQDPSAITFAFAY